MACQAFRLLSEKNESNSLSSKASEWAKMPKTGFFDQAEILFELNEILAELNEILAGLK